MSYCLNPYCTHPDDPNNHQMSHCLHCGSSLLIGDRYRVVKLLSDHSGFAQIFEVRDPEETPKILKVLKSHHNASEKVVELFQREAIVLKTLDHPGIPRIDDHGYFPYFARDSRQPLHCFVMEKINGPDLWEWLNQPGNGQINQEQAIDWLEQLAEILHRVHQQNYFHRDIKLQNIMLRPNGQLVLIDFGAAREMTYTYLLKTGQSGGVTKLSSAGYTPPEQQQGHAVPQSDFFALGRTFVYLLTGMHLDTNQIYDPFTNELHWREHAPDVSPALANLLDRMMAYRAADRPPNTKALLYAIANLQNPSLHATTHLLDGAPSQPPPSVPPSGSDTIFQSAQPATPETLLQVGPDKPTLSQTEPKRWRASPQLWGSVAIAILTLGGVGGWQTYQRLAPQIVFQQRAIAQTFTGHMSFVNDLVVSPDSQVLVSASADKTIKIWDLATGDLQQTLTGHKSFINTLLISPDGQYLFSASADATIKIWDLTTGELQRTLTGHTNFVDELLMSPDGQFLISSSADKTLRVWDWRTGTLTHTLEGHEGFVNVLAIAPDGQTLISGSADKTIRIWNLQTGTLQRILEGHESFVNSLVVSPDGQWLASGSADKTIRIWQLATGTLEHVLTEHTNFINDLAIAPDGQTLVSASADKTIKIWNLTTGELQQTLDQHQGYVNRLQISQDGQTLISGSADQTIRLWDLAAGTERQVLQGYQHHIDDFAISPDDRFIATGSGAKDIRVWPIEF